MRRLLLVLLAASCTLFAPLIAEEAGGDPAAASTTAVTSTDAAPASSASASTETSATKDAAPTAEAASDKPFGVKVDEAFGAIVGAMATVLFFEIPIMPETVTAEDGTTTSKWSNRPIKHIRNTSNHAALTVHSQSTMLRE